MKLFENMTAEERIRRSRTMLVLGRGDEPFYGSIALGLELIEDGRVPTGVTDGKVLVYNPRWIESIGTIEEIMGFTEHEVLHGAMKHPIRQLELMKIQGESFDMDVWQQACDLAINPILINKGRKLPGTPLYVKAYDGWSAERIYHELFEQKQQQKGKGASCPSKDGSDGKHGDDEQNQQSSQNGSSQGTPDVSAQTQSSGKSDPGGSKSKKGTGNGKPDVNGDSQEDNGESEEDQQKQSMFENLTDPGGCGGVIPPMDMDKEEPLSGEDLKDYQQDFENRVVNAARQIEKNQGDIPGFLKDIVKAHTTPQVTYKDHLWDIMEEITKDDYSMARPNKKFDEIYMPTLYDKVVGELIVVVDTSGSVSKREQKIYASEISGILEEFPNISILVIYHDTHVRNTQELAPEDLPISLEIKGGGGTNYAPVLDHIKKEGLDPKAIIWFTDLWVSQYTYNQCEKPDCELFWLNTSAPTRRSNPTFGTVIDLDPNA